MRRVAARLVLVGPLSLWACHSYTVETVPDAGQVIPVDSDAGNEPVDSGAPEDAGVANVDAGEIEDDAGTIIDAGSVVDAGPPDAGMSYAGVSCSTPPPAWSAEPAALPTYAGTCPTLIPGMMNTITSSGNQRQFIVAYPSDLGPDEQVPLFFLWHWLGGSAEDFYTTGQIAMAVEQMRFVAVIPQNKGDLLFKWPFTTIDTQARFDEEVQFFDDLLACVGSQLHVNRQCVGSAGVSAGALWTDQLIGVRSQFLSSFLSLSGGSAAPNSVGAFEIRPWQVPTHKLPGIVLWGGITDFCGIYFQPASQDLESRLEQNDEFFVECIHNCGHSEPPVTAPPGQSEFAGLWQFVFDHPFWLPPDTSPYQWTGLPNTLPSWCGIGAGSATPRTGPCNGSGCF